MEEKSDSEEKSSEKNDNEDNNQNKNKGDIKSENENKSKEDKKSNNKENNKKEDKKNNIKHNNSYSSFGVKNKNNNIIEENNSSEISDKSEKEEDEEEEEENSKNEKNNFEKEKNNFEKEKKSEKSEISEKDEKSENSNEKNEKNDKNEKKEKSEKEEIKEKEEKSEKKEIKEKEEKEENEENEESEENEENEESEENEENEEKEKKNNKKKNDKEKSENSEENENEKDEKKEIMFKKNKIDEEYVSNETRTLRSIFEDKISEYSMNENDYDYKNTKPCDPNDFAILFLEILLNNKEDISIIFNREKYQKFLDEIKENKNYLDIFKNIEKNEYKNVNFYEHLKQSKAYIAKPILLVALDPKEQKEVEFYKYGKTFSESIRKRFGIIINTKFYSSTQPLDKFDEEKAKDKTNYILNSKEIIRENYEGNEGDYDKKHNIWHNEDKVYRIKINYMTDKNKKSSFFIYCETEKERNQIFQLIKLTQMSLNIKEPANVCIKKTQKSIMKNNCFYALLKIMAVKNKLKNKNRINDYINKNILEKDKKSFNSFKKTIKDKIKEKYIEQRKFFYNKGINRDMKHLILNNKYLKRKINTDNNNIDNITKAVNKIYETLKKPNYSKNEKQNNNSFYFKVQDINKNNKNTTNINLNFNYKDICINSFNDNNNINNYLNKEQIFDISNIIYNFSFNNDIDNPDIKGENTELNKQFNLLILGPYINPGDINNDFNENNIYFDIKIQKYKYTKEAYDNIIINKKTKIDYLICQIFNCEINKSEIKNINYSSSITDKDYFYLKIIGGRNNNCTMQTKLYNPKIVKENLILLELNIELIIPYDFFSNKNEEIKIILYHIPKINIRENSINTILLDYINKNELKKFFFNLNMIKNRSYEALFEQCKKSKIFWNIIPFYQNKVCINNSNNKISYNYKKIPYYSKNLKIGNKFYYLENINEEKISGLINNKDIPSYYKYEKIERYLQNLNYYHGKKKSYIIPNQNNILNFNKDNNISKEIYYNDIKDIKGGLLNLCEYLGTNEKEEIFFHNLFTNEYKTRKFNENKFIIIQNNLY